MAYFNNSNPFAGVLRVIGKGGIPEYVSNSFGLGIRQHDDVMLAWGYSRQITKIVEIPSNNWVVVSLTVPSGVTHHAESRFLEAYNGILEATVVIGLDKDTEVPVVVEQIPAFNQLGPTLDPDVLSVFEYRGVHASNPITGTINDSTTVDNIHLHATTGQGSKQAGESSSSDVRGRHYKPGFYTVLVHNTSNATVELTYIYKWHEY